MLNQPLTQKGTTAMPKSVTIAGAVFTDPKILAIHAQAIANSSFSRIEVTQTKWSEGMQDYITSGVEYIVFPILNGTEKAAAIVDKEMPHLLPWKRNELINKVSRESFWKTQGDILGSQAL